MGIQDLTGSTFGHYELLEIIGEGGMAVVYRGYQANLKREVAVKVISGLQAQQAYYQKRFTLEAETSAALGHPHIVPVHDYGTERGCTYLVMKLLTGGTLEDKLTAHATEGAPLMSLAEIVKLLKDISGALDYAHRRGVIHRDVKPSNVMFDEHGHTYLVDFGIAKLTKTTSKITKAGRAVGTWGYMAPEQWDNQDLTAATDQYALGVMTYEIVTGTLPFLAQNPTSMMAKHVNEAPLPLHMLRPDAPAALSRVVARAIAKNVGDRFPHCMAFAQALEDAVRSTTTKPTATPIDLRVPPGKFEQDTAMPDPVPSPQPNNPEKPSWLSAKSSMATWRPAPKPVRPKSPVPLIAAVVAAAVAFVVFVVIVLLLL